VRKVLQFCKVKWEKTIKETRDKKATEDYDVPGDVLNFAGEDGLSLMSQLIKNICEIGE